MDAIIQRASALRGSVAAPPDKAICHRAVILSALADEPTLMTPWSPADDCQRTLTIMGQLGVPTARTAEGIRVDGVGIHGLTPPTDELDCGDSGTTMRLVCGVLAGQPFTSRLRAGPSLSRRPMRRIVEPLTQMGARIEGRSEGREVYPPLTIHGHRPLTAIRYPMPVASAQVKSAILLAGLYAEGRTEVIEPIQTRDHTERLLQYLGVQVRPEAPEGRTVPLDGPVQHLKSPGRLSIPADPSSAAFFIVAALLVPGSDITIPQVAMNPSRVCFLDLLKRMGADVASSIERVEWEPSGTITARTSALRGIRVTAGEAAAMIDELPILMVAASAAEGETRFEGVQELTVKETDRLRSMTAGLAALGARIERVGDAIVVIRGSRLQGSTVESFGDHRTAMSLAVAGLAARGTTVVKGVECTAKSFPGFFDQLQALAGSSTVKTGKAVDKPGGVC